MNISGAIFEQGTDDVQTAFKFAMLQHNQNLTGRKFEFQAYVDVINTADAFKLSRLSEYHFSFAFSTQCFNNNSYINLHVYYEI